MGYLQVMKTTLIQSHYSKPIFAFVLILFFFAEAVPSYGQNMLGWNRYNGWELTGYSVEGLPEALPGNLTGGLALSGQWKLLKGKVRPEFSTRILAEDLQRIRLYLAREGYPVATAEAVLDPVLESRQLAVLIQVQPGKPVRVAGLTLKGWPDGVDLPDTNNTQILQKNNIFQDEKIHSSVAGLKTILLNSGYANSSVVCAVDVINAHSVQLVFTVDAGDFFQLKEIEVSGCSEDLKPLALRIINIEPGTEYSQERLNEAGMDLRTTQLFSKVILETEPIDPGFLLATAHLQNARMRRWSAAVGSWSDNPWMVRAGWMHRNLFSKGRSFDANAVVATHEQSVGAGITWLGILSPRARTRVSVEYIREDENAYLSNEYRTELVQSFRPSERNIWNVGITLSHVNVEEFGVDDDMPESQGILLELWTDRKWDWTDSPLYPTRGGYLKTSITYSPTFLISESPYAAVQLDGVGYKHLAGKILLAGRCRVGLAEPLGDSHDIISSRRFFAGGYNTHRGYSRNDLGPRDNDGNPRGGQAVLLAGLEARLPLVWLFDIALFVDTGQLWEVRTETDFGDMAVAFGVDLDLRTPLGPLRFGYAWNQTTPGFGQSEGMWHGGIGYPW